MTANDQREQQDTGSTPASEGPSDRARDESANREGAKGPPNPRDSKAGFDREVGDIDDPEAVEDEGALPGRMGGGLAGG